MSCRFVAITFIASLAACQTSSPSQDGGSNTNQNATVPLGQNGNSSANNPVGNGNVTNPNGQVAGNGNAVNANNTNVVVGPDGSSATFDPNGVQFLGRVTQSQSLLSWSGSGVAATFTGTQAQLSFSPRAGNTYMGVSVDGGAMNKVLINTNNIISTGNLSNGRHTVTAIKLNEPSMGTATFNGISTRGSIVATQALGRRIEFIGDSITVGYGIEGTSPCTNNSSLENASKTYAALTATGLGADYDLIAWSGKGLMRNAAQIAPDVSPTMPTLWTRINATDANSLYDFPASRTPDAVVVNLGTNDFTYIGYTANGDANTVRAPLDPAAYVAAYVSFLQKVRSVYPQAFIELCSSPMLSDSYPTAAEAQHTTQLTALQQVVSQMGDSRVHVVDFPTEAVGAGINGCDSHPSPTQHAAMAKILTAALKQDLGW